MIQLIVCILLLFGAPYSGWTSRYAEGVMQLQVDYHDLQTPCDDCAIAVSDCALIGDTWLIRPLGDDKWTPVVIADCAGKDALDSKGISWMDRHNIVMELSYGLAVRFGALASIEIEILR